MLLREKVFLVFIAIFCFITLVDLTTQLGNMAWEKVSGLSNRYAINQGSKIGYINRRGRLIVKPRLKDGARYFTQELSPAAVGNKWGFINKWGRKVIKPKFVMVKEFSEGLARVAKKGKFISRWGYIDKSGRYVVSPKFVEAKEFSEGLACVKIEGRWGYIDKTGELLIEPRFDSARSFSEKLAPVRIGPKWGFIDDFGTIVIEAKYDDVKSFKYGLSPVSTDYKWGYINKNGDVVVELKFNSADVFSEGFAVVKSEGVVSVIDTKGTVVIEEDYLSDIRNFSEGLAAVEVNFLYDHKSDGKWGYIDNSGEFLINPKFDWAWDFNGDLARVGVDKNDVRRGYLDKKGKLVWDPANWERSTYVKQIVYSILIVLLFWYSIMLVRFRRIVRERVANLNEQAEKRKGFVTGGGLISELRLIFEHNGVKFSITFSGHIMRYFQPEIYFDAEITTHQDTYVSLYMNMESKSLEFMDLRESAIFKTGNDEFDNKVKVPQTEYNDVVGKLLTPLVQNKIMECKLVNCIFRLGIAVNKFQIQFNGILKNTDEYDWFIDTAVMIFEEYKMMEFKNNKKDA